VSRQLVFRPQIEQEVTAATERYNAHGAGLAPEFLRALDAVVASIQRNPLQSPEVYPRMRPTLFRRFPYRIVFSSVGIRDRRTLLFPLAPEPPTVADSVLASIPSKVDEDEAGN
jgi:hypothetical protein